MEKTRKGNEKFKRYVKQAYGINSFDLEFIPGIKEIKELFGKRFGKVNPENVKVKR